MLGRKSAKDQLIETLMKQNADLLDRLQEMIGQIHYHQVQANVQAIQAQARDTAAPMYVSEAEEDAVELATQADGTINEELLQKYLEAARFENSEVEFHSL